MVIPIISGPTISRLPGYQTKVKKISTRSVTWNVEGIDITKSEGSRERPSGLGVVEGRNGSWFWNACSRVWNVDPRSLFWNGDPGSLFWNGDPGFWIGDGSRVRNPDPESLRKGDWSLSNGLLQIVLLFVLIIVRVSSSMSLSSIIMSRSCFLACLALSLSSSNSRNMRRVVPWLVLGREVQKEVGKVVEKEEVEMEEEDEDLDEVETILLIQEKK